MNLGRILLRWTLASLCLLSGVALAQVVTEFSIGITAGSRPANITAGPDGNLWFTEYQGNRIGRITPQGVVTEFSAGITVGSGPWGITAGPDGNLWFTELQGDRIGRITPQGVVTEFICCAPISGALFPAGITAGPDGNLWFTVSNANRIGRITPDGVVTEFTAGITALPGYGITAGPDDNLWYTGYGGNTIGRITPQGVVTEFSADTNAGSTPFGITAGPDGNLWFAEPNGNPIGRITPQGVVTMFSAGVTAGAKPAGIAAGADGNLWFTQPDGNRIGRITPQGVVTEFSAGITAGARPLGIAAGPDGNLWFAEIDGNRIGRIITPGGTAPPVVASAASRKVHGGAGTFNLPLLAVTTNPTTEPRQGPAQTVVFTFDKAVNAATGAVTEGAAVIGVLSFSGNDVIVPLAGVTDQQYVTIALSNVASTDGGTGGSGSVRIGFLLGDVNGSRVVTLADVGQVNGQLAQPVMATNYLKDVNAGGTLTLVDKVITNANLTRSLAPP